MPKVIFAILLSATLLASSGFVAPPASAAVNSWSAEPVPSQQQNVLGPPGIDIRDLAVASNGSTVYAAPGDSIPAQVIYKSSDTGHSWTALETPITADMVAVAPDDAQTIAIASANESLVSISRDGGLNWVSLGTPQGSAGAAAAEIAEIAVSAGLEGRHYLAVAGGEAANIANLWYYELGAVAPAWQETGSFSGFAPAGATRAVTFSPDFPADRRLVTVTVTQHAAVSVQALDLATRQWNNQAGFSGYPVTVVNSSGITDLAAAAVAFDTTSHDPRAINLYLGLTIQGDNSAQAQSGLYHLDNAASTALQTGRNIHSIAFNGNSLIAGAYDSSTVYRISDTAAPTPAISASPRLKSPGGESRTVIAWAGDTAIAGTSGADSAFAVSRNHGETFQDISLIDTALTAVRDVAVSADGETVYLTTDNGTNLSVWRKVSSWERVLSQSGAGYLIRIAPEDPDSVYVFRQGGTSIFTSRSGGESDWSARECVLEVQDLTVTGASTAYALSGEGKVTGTANGGFSWSNPVPTGLSEDTGYSISAHEENILLAGSTNGYVAYSTNGNKSWSVIPRVLQFNAGRVQVIADKNFATNKTIYAASDTSRQNISRWVIGSSSTWTDIFRSVVSGGVFGFSMQGGTLYALESGMNATQSTLWQCLSPGTATGTSASWSPQTTTGAQVRLNASPQALREGPAHKLWAIKTNDTNGLYSLTQVLTAVSLKSPEPNFRDPVNQITGVANGIVFSWERLTTDPTEYRLFLSYDENFTALVTAITVTETAKTVVVRVGPEGEGDARINFQPGTTYYWRVQITGPFLSPYSPARSFTVIPLLTEVPRLLTPANGATNASRTPSFSWQPVSGATEYRFVLADNAALSAPMVDVQVGQPGYALSQELTPGKTYFWAVRPLDGDWSATGIFTVREEPVAPAPPVIVQQLPPPVINLPAPSPPPLEIVITPSPVTTPPTTPAYLWALVGIVTLLASAAIVLALKPSLVAAAIYGSRGKRLQGDRPVSFAVKAFLWMLTTGDKEKHFLSAREEEKLGQVIVSRIRETAAQQLIYRKSPGDAPLFLELWARYGSREETNRYLTRSFIENPRHVLEFLKCYLPPGQAQPFDIKQYEAIARVVEPESIITALRALYGNKLGNLDTENPEHAVAAQFARIYLKPRFR